MIFGNKYLNQDINLAVSLTKNVREPLNKKKSIKKQKIAKTQPVQLTNVNQDLIKNNQYQQNTAIKLPEIEGKNLYSLTSIYKKYLTNESNKKINPYLQKYFKFKSEQKQKQDQDRSQSLSILCLKPFDRKQIKITSENRLKIKQKNVKQGIQILNKINIKRQESYENSVKNIQSRKIKTLKNNHNNNTTSFPREHAFIKRIKDSPSNKIKLIPKKPLKLNHQCPYRQWCKFLTFIDGVEIQKQNEFQTYKAYIGKGNNHTLLKNAIKTRYWWNLTSNQSQANFYWTQSRKKKYIQNLNTTNKQKFQYSSKKYSLMPLVQKATFLSEKIKTHVKQNYEKLISNRQLQTMFCSSSRLSLQIKKPFISKNIFPSKSNIHNHLEFNWNLCNKKGLYYNIKEFYQKDGNRNVQLIIPETYHVVEEGDSQWISFLKSYQDRKGFWIVKPGQNSNRGCGIDVVEDLQDIRQIIKNKSINSKGKKRSHIIQRYIMPLLYNKRKFDIRCYMLVTTLNGNLRCYWYEEGYVRTASKEFTLKNLKNRMIHLTNDAVQKYSQDYGKHQSGNKLSFQDIDKYISSSFKNVSFYENIYPQMMKQAQIAVKAANLSLDRLCRQHTFQIFGLDFMIDQNFRTWLIEVNTNPCLQLSCPLLSRIIPDMIQNSLRIALDPIFPPPRDSNKLKHLNEHIFQRNRYTLIFSARQNKTNKIDCKQNSENIEIEQNNDSCSQSQL